MMERVYAPAVKDVASEKQELVRRRTFSVRSLEDIPHLLATLKREGFVGSVRFNVGPGGVPQSIETEERAKL